jgi:hypothetical protein
MLMVQSLLMPLLLLRFIVVHLLYACSNKRMVLLSLPLLLHPHAALFRVEHRANVRPTARCRHSVFN